MRPRSNDTGSTALELALIAPVLIAAMLLVVFAGRVAQVSAAVTRAASEASRAASLRQRSVDAIEDARKSAGEHLAAEGVRCSEFDAGVDTERFEAGGAVTVNLTCTVPMADLALLGVPGTRSFSASSTDPIDFHRSQP